MFRGSGYLANHSFPVPVSVLKVTRLIISAELDTFVQVFPGRNGAPDSVWCTYSLTMPRLSVPPILKLLGCRIIISRRDMGYWQNRRNLLPLRLNARYVDKVIVNSEAVRDMTIAREGYLPERVEVIYNGYDPADNPLPEDAETVVPQGKTLKLVLVANIRAVKRIQDAIHAMARLRESHPDSVLCIIGDGDHTELADLCSRLGILENVTVSGTTQGCPGIAAGI